MFAEKRQQEAQRRPSVVRRTAQLELVRRQIFVVACEPFERISFSVGHVPSAFLQERVVAHKVHFGHAADGYELGLVANAGAIQLLFVDVQTAQAAGLNLTFGTSVLGLDKRAYFAKSKPVKMRRQLQFNKLIIRRDMINMGIFYLT